MSFKDQELQYYNNNFEYDIFQNSSWINLKYDEIINWVPTKLDFNNYWYRENFIPWVKEFWEWMNFWLDKREWFTACFNVEWFHPTDVKQINWNLYWFFVADDFSEMQVRWEFSALNDWCNNYVNEDCTRKIRKIACHSFSKCTYDKFTKVVAPTWLKDRRTWKVVHEIIWWTIVSKLTRISNNTPDDISPGDYVMILRNDNVNGWTVCWQYRRVARVDDWIIVWAPWLWLLSRFTTSIWSDWVTKYTWENWSQSTVEEEIEYKVFRKVSDTLAYAWLNWVFYLHELEWDESWCDVENGNDTILCQTEWAKFPITSIAEYNDDTISFLTWWSIFFWQWWQNAFNFSYQIEVWDEYRYLLNLHHYTIILWPESMKIAYDSSLDSSWTPIPRVVRLTDNFWYFTPGSFSKYFREWTDQFILMNSYWDLRKYDITPVDNWLWSVKFVLNSNEIWGKFIASDLRILSREQWDIVNISEWDAWFRIFIHDYKNGKSSNKFSKIIHYNDRYKFFHKWIVCWIVIVDERYGRWWGDKVYKNVWKTDDWNEIKQYLSWKFWDQTSRFYKIVHHHMLWLLTRSNITQTTILAMSVQLAWYYIKNKENNFLSAQYVRNINKFNNMRDWNNNEELILEKNYWVGVYTWAWTWHKDVQVWRTSTQDIEAFCEYDIDKTNPMLLCDWRYWALHKKLEQNFEKSEQNNVYIAKWEHIKTPINCSGEIFFFELMWWWADRIAISWTALSFQFKDPKITAFENITHKKIVGRKPQKQARIIK